LGATLPWLWIVTPDCGQPVGELVLSDLWTFHQAPECFANGAPLGSILKGIAAIALADPTCGVPSVVLTITKEGYLHSVHTAHSDLA